MTNFAPKIANMKKMDVGLSVLMHLWATQKKRDFSWRTFFVGLILVVYFITILLVVYFGLRQQLQEMGNRFEWPALAPLLAVSIVPADLMMKVFWRRSPVEMDDYLRTRPISQRTWSRFILFDTSLGGLQWMMPLMMTFIAGLVLPWWAALLTLVLTYACVMVNALFQNCWRRAPGNQWTLPLVFAYLVWLVMIYAIAIVSFVVIGLAGDDPSTPVRPGAVAVGLLVSTACLLAANLLAGWLLQRYFTRLRNHNEEMHAPVHAATARSLGEVSVWSIEWVQLIRSKRLRTSFLVIAIVFLLNVYLQQLTPSIETDSGIHVNPMLMFGIGFPSLILAQWVLGIEANFFSGIWTKPWPVEGILRRKYVFFCMICVLMALLIVPAVLFMHLSVWAWLAALLFSCGIFILPFMSTCLFSSRMDLFASAFFNYQGGNKQINVFSFVMFIPIIIYYGVYFLLPTLWAHLLIASLGLIGILLHRPYIHWIASLWFKRRYKIMERWLTE